MIFVHDHRAAKLEVFQALLVAEGALAEERDIVMRRVALERLTSEIDVFVAATGISPEFRPQAMKLFVASGCRSLRAAKLVDAVNDFRLRLWVRVLLTPITFPIRLVVAAVRMAVAG